MGGVGVTLFGAPKFKHMCLYPSPITHRVADISSLVVCFPLTENALKYRSSHFLSSISLGPSTMSDAKQKLSK